MITCTALPRGSVTLSVTGGSGTGYTWSRSTDASVGTNNATTGAYTAGATGGVADVDRVVDSLGNPVLSVEEPVTRWGTAPFGPFSIPDRVTGNVPSSVRLTRELRAAW